MPGHVNAALASYGSSRATASRPRRTLGSRSASARSASEGATYAFLDDVLGELAALTPGRYLHVGGDEPLSTDPEDYRFFVERVQRLVRSHGKRVIPGRRPPARGSAPRRSCSTGTTRSSRAHAVAQGAKLVLSPSKRMYLDMKYARAPLGLEWAGRTSVRKAYDWDPADVVEGIAERDVLGVERRSGRRRSRPAGLDWLRSRACSASPRPAVARGRTGAVPVTGSRGTVRLTALGVGFHADRPRGAEGLSAGPRALPEPSQVFSSARGRQPSSRGARRAPRRPRRAGRARRPRSFRRSTATRLLSRRARRSRSRAGEHVRSSRPCTSRASSAGSGTSVTRCLSGVRRTSAFRAASSVAVRCGARERRSAGATFAPFVQRERVSVVHRADHPLPRWSAGSTVSAPSGSRRRAQHGATSGADQSLGTHTSRVSSTCTSVASSRIWSLSTSSAVAFQRPSISAISSRISCSSSARSSCVASTFSARRLAALRRPGGHAPARGRASDRARHRPGAPPAAEERARAPRRARDQLARLAGARVGVQLLDAPLSLRERLVETVALRLEPVADLGRLPSARSCAAASLRFAQSSGVSPVARRVSVSGCAAARAVGGRRDGAGCPSRSPEERRIARRCLRRTYGRRRGVAAKSRSS